MKVSIINLHKIEDSSFFAVALEDDSAGHCMIIDGWRYSKGRIQPPAKQWKKNYYPTVLVSPDLAKAVQAALVTIGFEDAELEPATWFTLKWGQHGLKRLCATEEVALSYWQKYRR